MTQISKNMLNSKHILAQLQDLKSQAQQANLKQQPKAESGPSFMDHLKDSVNEVNQMHHDADKMAVKLSTGESQNIHETMLAATQAELSFNLMVQVRNKVLEAYQEVMRMQV